MKITKLYEVQTDSNIATGEEIATLVVNLNRGQKLIELKAVNDKVYFVFEEIEIKPCEYCNGGRYGPKIQCIEHRQIAADDVYEGDFVANYCPNCGRKI
jgi:hypothetical protein